MAEPETKRDSSARIQIIVALIGLAGVVATALISNWSNIFPRKTPAPTPTVSSPTSGPTPERTPERTGQAEITHTTAKQPEPENKPERTGQASEHPVHSGGRLIIQGTYFYDLDTGTEQDAGADFWYAHNPGQDWFLIPQNGAAFYVVGPTEFESVRWSDMEHFPYSTERIIASEGPSNRIPAGTVVAYRTNEGRLGKFIVDKFGFNLSIRWRTYD